MFIGDLIDNHYVSLFEKNPDGFGATEELEKAKANIKAWEVAFPVANICIGNHDRRPDKRRFNVGLTKHWIKTIDEVLGTANWIFKEEFNISDVLYIHGDGKQAKTRIKTEHISVVQGHYHTKGYIEFSVGKDIRIFGMQVGCGIDPDTYGMAYARHHDKPHISCGVVLEDGRLPILEYMF